MCDGIVAGLATMAFEELTLSGQDDQLKVQVPDAWPNLFREARFLSAVDFVQGDRLRRKFAMEMQRVREGRARAQDNADVHLASRSIN